MKKHGLRDRDENIYIIKQIDAGNEQVKVVAQIDIDDFKSVMYEKYSNNSATVNQTVLSVLPAGWDLHRPFKRYDTAYNPDKRHNDRLQRNRVGRYCKDCCNVYGVRFRFNSADKIVTIINPEKL